MMKPEAESYHPTQPRAGIPTQGEEENSSDSGRKSAGKQGQPRKQGYPKTQAPLNPNLPNYGDRPEQIPQVQDRGRGVDSGDLSHKKGTTGE